MTHPRPPLLLELGDVVPLPWGEEGAESDIPPTMPEVCNSDKFPNFVILFKNKYLLLCVHISKHLTKN